MPVLKIGAAFLAAFLFVAPAASATWRYQLPSKGLAGAPSLPAGFFVLNGQTWMPANTTLTYTYYAAVAMCAGTINGSTGWRLPTGPEVTALSAAMRAGQAPRPVGGWQTNYFWNSRSTAAGTHVIYAISDGASDYIFDHASDSWSYSAACVK